MSSSGKCLCGAVSFVGDHPRLTIRASRGKSLWSRCKVLINIRIQSGGYCKFTMVLPKLLPANKSLNAPPTDSMPCSIYSGATRSPWSSHFAN